MSHVDERTLALQAPSSAVIVASTSNPVDDLRRERAKASFNARELEALLHGGADMVHLRRRIADVMTSQDVFSKRGKYFL